MESMHDGINELFVHQLWIIESINLFWITGFVNYLTNESAID